ncbi:MAG TPA: Rrf2 family transcriptional regulator [Gemmataceae bacterium]|nr:Rrf2 family transcriptional regulator [Gemmataceae bacterium]
MKLTRASSYALTTLAYLAREKPADPVPSHEIAKAEGIPERFLLKVLKPLVDSGVLRSLKGPNGGYRLGRAPKDITLLEVVEAVDGSVRSLAEPVGKAGVTPLDKRLQAVCDDVAAMVRERMARVTLAELAKGR